MDISSLELFTEVVRQGSFAAAARERRMDPSSVSRAIAAFEDELGTRLFQRSTRQLAPTEAGQLYFERITPLLDELRQAQAAAIDISAQPKGVLRVNSAVAFGMHGIVPMLPQFHSDYPELTVELQLSDNVVDLYAERIDLAVRLAPMVDSSLVAQPLMDNPSIVCASPQYLHRHGTPQAVAELAQYSCLLFLSASESGRWVFMDGQGVQTSQNIGGRLAISNPLALRQCALAGMGLALLSRWLISDDLRHGRLVQVLPQYRAAYSDFDAAAWLVYPSRSYVPLKVRVFIDALKSSLSS